MYELTLPFWFSTFWGYRAQLCRHIVIAWEATTETFSPRQSSCVFCRKCLHQDWRNVWCRDLIPWHKHSWWNIYIIITCIYDKMFWSYLRHSRAFKTFRSSLLYILVLIECQLNTCTSKRYFWRIVVWPFCHGQKSGNKELSLCLFQRSKFLVKTSCRTCLLYLLFIWWHLKLVFVECFFLLYH